MKSDGRLNKTSLKIASLTVFEPWFFRGIEDKCRGRLPPPPPLVRTLEKDGKPEKIDDEEQNSPVVKSRG